MRALRKEQIRRLGQGMADPSDGHETIVIRVDHVKALLRMIARRERVAFDILNDVCARISDDDVSGVKKILADFLRSADKWEDDE